MIKVFWIADNMISPLGSESGTNYNLIRKGNSSIAANADFALNGNPFYASTFSEYFRNEIISFQASGDATFFEKLCCRSIQIALDEASQVFNAKNTVFILSTTKGNIELIDNSEDERIRLHHTAKRILNHLKLEAYPIVVSNACISGISAMITASRLLKDGQFEHAIICGADMITDFVAKGFQALHATADNHCKPYDEQRSGINLGEAAGTIILSAKKGSAIEVKGGAVTNDANHISGPSKTGDELALAVKISMSESAIGADDLAFISAHGTATVYNDEMESKAFELAGLSDLPLNSLKPHFGHTLGAAGIIESIISKYAILDNSILPTLNFTKKGVSGNINICSKRLISSKKYFLKTASGFGGCNASIVYQKN
jgi:3-oxoacyl-[acyl-carrier-protein] synthase-1